MTKKKPNKVDPPTCVRLSEDTRRTIRDLARGLGLTQSELHREALEAGLRKIERDLTG